MLTLFQVLRRCCWKTRFISNGSVCAADECGFRLRVCGSKGVVEFNDGRVVLHALPKGDSGTSQAKPKVLAETVRTMQL